MVEILGNLVELYVEPLLTFVGAYISEDNHIRPANHPDPNVIYRYQDKDIVVCKDDLTFQKYRQLRDEVEIFNPLIVNRHMTFLASLVVNHVNSICDPLTTIASKVVYDEDLDEYVATGEDVTDDDLETMTKVGMLNEKTPEGLTKLSISYIDKDNNPSQTIASYTHIMPIFAMYGVCLEVYKLFTKRVPPQLKSTDTAILTIYAQLNRYEREKSKNMKELTGFQAIDMVDEEKDRIIMSYFDEIEFDLDIDVIRNDDYIPMSPFLSKDMVDLENPDSIFYDKYHLITPEFKIVDEENEDIPYITDDNDFNNINLSF
jgi:hypothetical protein